MPSPKPLAEPHKELRFTRAGQGHLFFVLGAAAAGLAVILAFFAFLPERPLLPRWAFLLPLPVAALFFRIGLRCVRHAYLIFTPLGVEIFPFFNPRDKMQVIYWSEIAHAEVDPARTKLILHYDADRTSGLVASLRPVPRTRRNLIHATVDGVMARRPAAGDIAET
ncbi:MAG: hypothetical protein HKN82_15140 [Akkermansiaceae bacterium]|nr:hypothetical protein [Akkermansiaceae bacterium]NNM31394.1 hypothetical protein [Akkermansiaceae bacterium]